MSVEYSDDDEDVESSLFEEDPNSETEDDLGGERVTDGAQAVLTSSDWTVETLLQQLKSGNINLSPNFQRRDVWNPLQKSRFIESIFLNLPVPQLVLAENREDPNTFIVLDGKQRLLTMRQFASEDDEGSDGESTDRTENAKFTRLVLKGLQIRKDLNGTSYADISGSARDKNAFDNYTIRTVVIRRWPNEDYLYRVFLRLNTGSVRLNSQELRLALNPSEFMNWLDEYAIKSTWIRKALGMSQPDHPDRRMRDTELLLRHLAFVNYLNAYQGDLSAFLNKACRDLTDQWALDGSVIEDQLASCKVAVDAVLTIFGPRDSFRRWRTNGFERQFNRAIFDAFIFWFTKENVALLAIEHPEEVKRAFISLCSTDLYFVQSISTTTKSNWAVAYRLRELHNSLEEVLGDLPPVGAWIDEHAVLE